MLNFSELGLWFAVFIFVVCARLFLMNAFKLTWISCFIHSMERISYFHINFFSFFSFVVATMCAIQTIKKNAVQESSREKMTIIK